jgi:thioredoxin 1
MNNFDSIIEGDIPVVVDFFAEWCAPCKMMPPVLKQVKEKAGSGVMVLKMDVDKNPYYSQKYGIQSIPTLMIFQRGKMVWRKSGATTAGDILQHLPKE